VRERTGQTSVCIMRIETEVDRLLITLTIERYLHRGLAVAGDPRVTHFARVDEAIDAVAEFVRSHHPPTAPNG
jgi:hypothetical protein